MLTLPQGGAEPSKDALSEHRSVYWSPEMGSVETPCYQYAKLLPGNLITGPAIIESPETTYVVEPGWRFELDVYGNGIMEFAAESETTN